jgi:hypothetical protein
MRERRFLALRRAGLALCLALAAIVTPAPAAAQQTGTGESSAAQTSNRTVFVSRLKAEPVDYQIKLSWIDSPDITGSCLVYRSKTEISTQTIGQATLIGTADTGVGYFVDTPPDMAGYFYAVLLRDSAGNLFPIVIAFRNKTSLAVAAETPAPEEKLAARITTLKAGITASGDAIEVSFISSNPTRDLLLFWGTAPLSSAESLIGSTSTTPLDPGTTRYKLAALPGVDYWFAVLDAGMYKIGKVSLEKGVNATLEPVSVPMTASTTGSSAPSARRTLPLPSLALSSGVQSGLVLSSQDVPDLPAQRRVSSATEKAIAALMQQVRKPGPARMAPQVLPADTTPSPSVEVARLQDIVRGPFLGGDMTGAQKRLLEYLGLPRSPEIEAHARFYLGQIHYFTGDVREALMEFLLAEEYFYLESERWIDACFARLEE